MGYGILRGQKIKTGGIAGIDIHNHRKRPSRSNKDIDRKKTAENYSLLDEGDKKLTERVAERVKELSGGRKIRSDAVKMYDFVATASPEDMTRLSNSQQKQFFVDTRDFLVRKFGSKNLMYGMVHMDEATPHAHFGIVPEYEGRLCAKKLFTPKSLQKLQDDYYREVLSKYGLQRGEAGSKRKHVGTSKYKGVTGYNGKERENLDQLEKVIKEKPVTEGIFQKEVVGYQISPAAADELIRLARVGGQAADERAAREKAEEEKKISLEREKETIEENKRLRGIAEDLQEENETLRNDYQKLRKETSVFQEAPEKVRKPVIEAAQRHAQRRDALHAFLGRCERSVGAKKALENPAVKGVCRLLKVEEQDRPRFLEKCGKMISGGKGKDAGLWSALPAPAKVAAMPIKIIKGAVEQAFSIAKQVLSTVAGASAKEPEITAGFKYLEEHGDAKSSPWCWLSESKKAELQYAREKADYY